MKDKNLAMQGVQALSDYAGGKYDVNTALREAGEQADIALKEYYRQ